jgi:hypothetical protein
MLPQKIIVTSKTKLQLKYGAGLQKIEAQIQKLIATDLKKNVDTRWVYIDDAASAKKAGIAAVKSISPRSCKKAIDDLYAKHSPAYIMIFGAQDVIPFQEIDNPTGGDDDATVPSDLPYCCETGYSAQINAFTGPTRVVGRLPDIPGKGSVAYVNRLIRNIMRSKPRSAELYQNYFSVSCQVWTKSTQLSLANMFGNFGQLLISPPSGKNYTPEQLKSLTHFFNLHGARNDYAYYGQKGSHYPQALHTGQLTKAVAFGTMVAAECCYGAELVDGEMTMNQKDLSIANQYLQAGALAFVGSSTIAYGPPDGQGLADLITQYFISAVLNGASTGRAMLMARQKFLEASGPSLDPYELKTLAQFYLLGDPSIQLCLPENGSAKSSVAVNPTFNNRLNLFNKGEALKKTIAPSEKASKLSASKNKKQIEELLKQKEFTHVDKEELYEVKARNYTMAAMPGSEAKSLSKGARFRTFVQDEEASPKRKFKSFKVMVVKESDIDILGWRMYVSR